ncbi:MAG: peptidyl-prolyl cis-trans isomerase [Chthoniobacterales bacterium]
MINVMRKNQRILWIIIAILALPFVFYFQSDILNFGGNNEAGRLYGRPVSHVEFQRNARFFNLARELGMTVFLQDMVSGANSLEEAYAEFTWNRLILRHEAERLGIQPSGPEIAKVVRNLQAFGSEKGFDLSKYNQFTQTVLPALGFGEAQIEEVVADQLTLDRVKELIAIGVHVPEAEREENYTRAFGKNSVSLVRLRSEDFGEDLQIGEEEIAKYYETHQAELKSEEKRKVSFVSFGLDEEQKKLAGKERIEVLQKAADRANDFNQALLEKGAQFEELAAKFQMPIQVTGEFTRSAPDPLLSADPQLATAAWQLTPQEPNSDAIQVTDSFYILHLSGVDPPKPLTLEEATPKIVESLKNQRVREMVASKGAEAAQKIRDALKSGVPLDAALQASGLPAEKIPPFALSDQPALKVEPEKQPEPETPDLPMIKSAVSALAPGEVSTLIPTQTGGIVAVLEKREEPQTDPSDPARNFFNLRFLKGKRDLAFHEWLRERRREAGVQPAAETAEGMPVEPG